MAYRNDYTFKKRFNRNGEKTQWFKILSYLIENGPATKQQILTSVYDAKNWKPLYGICELTSKYFPCEHYVVSRGFISNTFAQMRCAGIIEYNKHTKMWNAC